MTRQELIDAFDCGTQIADDAAKHGYKPVLLGGNGKKGDASLTLWDCEGLRVIVGNGDAVWEHSDPDGFAELLAELQSS